MVISLQENLRWGRKERGKEKEPEEKIGEETEEGIEELHREITVEEMVEALMEMKNGKAGGEDGVAIEFIKNLPGIEK